MTRQLGATVFAFPLVVTACGGSTGGSDGVATLEGSTTVTTAGEGDSNADPGTVDQERAMLDFAAYMRANGVDMADPTIDSKGNVRFGGFRGVADAADVYREAVRAAMEKCSDNIEGLVLGRGGGGLAQLNPPSADNG